MTGMEGERENDGQKRKRVLMSEILPSRVFGHFNLTLSSPANVAMLTMKGLKTSAKIKDIFFISASFEINPSCNYVKRV